ncbi:MAG: class I SAM-dependent methyltransferase [Lachnospiraceae bacterium]|jgi:ubiquinone/menaquinone biosynthesis C-methylase UbiE|nr:class I SAM-dependent methyltransferase [Lachnospiraceae bacterium]
MTPDLVARMKEKLESPWRVAELNPKDTLMRIGLMPSKTFCDIGAGTGLFVKAARELEAGGIFAVDTSEPMQEYLRASFRNTDGGENAEGCRFISVCGSIEEVPDSAADIALLCTVLHEVEDQEEMIRQMFRILRKEGTAAVIEFRPEAKKGAPPEVRISPDALKKMMAAGGFACADDFLLGENLYACTFSKVQT